MDITEGEERIKQLGLTIAWIDTLHEDSSGSGFAPPPGMPMSDRVVCGSVLERPSRYPHPGATRFIRAPPALNTLRRCSNSSALVLCADWERFDRIRHERPREPADRLALESQDVGQPVTHTSRR